MIDRDGLIRVARAIDKICREERAAGTNRDTIEMALLHCWKTHKPRDDEQPVNTDDE